MIEYTFRHVVESVRTGQTIGSNQCRSQAGDLFMLVSGRPLGFTMSQQQPDDNPIRAVVEVSKVEDGPAPFKHFVRWDRLVFDEATPTYLAEIAFDRQGHPRYNRLVAISKRPDETARKVIVVDLEEVEILTTDFDRLKRIDETEDGSATATDA